jgi:tRNA-Thr(GGU) m(6)t(6)A37 methyltransferase TsaA
MLDTVPMPGRPAPKVATVEIGLRPIGYAHTPFADRMSTPRQPHAAKGARGTIELLPNHNFEDGLSDLDRWDHIWVIFWFHLNAHWRPKVLPPRSSRRRGVFATRSPHRPNPLGLSVLELEAVEGLCLRVRNIDVVDGTPVLDIKPYLPFADAIPAAKSGWLETPDPEPAFEIHFAPLAEEQSRWLRSAHTIDLAAPITHVLSIGPAPRPYRRIRREGEGFRLCLKDWRVFFRVEGRRVTVESIATGYRPRELANPSDPALTIHRAYVARFGALPREP